MLLAALTATALAGPWVHPQGEGYLRLGGDHFQAASGVVDGQSTGLQYRSESLSLYGEWGLGRSTQLVGSLPMVTATQREAEGEGAIWRHTWTGDLRLELDHALKPGRPLALGAELRLPTYRDPAQFAEAQGVEPSLLPSFVLNFPQLGDRNVDLTLKALGGVSGARGWAWGELGPRLRFGGYAHSLHAASSVGAWAVPDHLALAAWTNLTLRAPWITPERATRQEWGLTGQALIALPQAAPGWMLELRGGGVLWAESAARGWSAGLGLSYTHRKER
ncbi:MAG: hypothetical protein H6740_04435 [Alphaproteobacteria bacterium]|nr:hypothetical protein [Alphaproteobacteria bacterium]